MRRDSIKSQNPLPLSAAINLSNFARIGNWEEVTLVETTLRKSKNLTVFGRNWKLDKWKSYIAFSTELPWTLVATPEQRLARSGSNKIDDASIVKIPWNLEAEKFTTCLIAAFLHTFALSRRSTVYSLTSWSFCSFRVSALVLSMSSLFFLPLFIESPSLDNSPWSVAGLQWGVTCLHGNIICVSAILCFMTNRVGIRLVLVNFLVITGSCRSIPSCWIHPHYRLCLGNSHGTDEVPTHKARKQTFFNHSNSTTANTLHSTQTDSSRKQSAALTAHKSKLCKM